MLVQRLTGIALFANGGCRPVVGRADDGTGHFAECRTRIVRLQPAASAGTLLMHQFLEHSLAFLVA
jgi:hypothetical protein